MNETKSILKSSTLWSLLATLLPMVGSWIGFDFTAIIQDHTISINQIIEVAGLIFAAYNRINATHQLVVKPKTTE